MTRRWKKGNRKKSNESPGSTHGYKKKKGKSLWSVRRPDDIELRRLALWVFVFIHAHTCPCGCGCGCFCIDPQGLSHKHAFIKWLSLVIISWGWRVNVLLNLNCGLSWSSVFIPPVWTLNVPHSWQKNLRPVVTAIVETWGFCCLICWFFLEAILSTFLLHFIPMIPSIFGIVSILTFLFFRPFIYISSWIFNLYILVKPHFPFPILFGQRLFSGFLHYL